MTTMNDEKANFETDAAEYDKAELMAANSDWDNEPEEDDEPDAEWNDSADETGNE